jgi:hypothetical protein
MHRGKCKKAGKRTYRAALLPRRFAPAKLWILSQIFAPTSTSRFFIFILLSVVHLFVNLTPVNMPRGKAWSKAESIALVEAFVHISEDEIIGTNQRSDTLYERVVAEAKSRYAGDWHRGISACKSRWHIVSREVQKFIGIDLLIQSTPRSGWNENNYYDAAVRAYFVASKPDVNIEDITEEESLQFEFKAEWEILREHEKWHATLSKQEKKRASPTRSEDGSDEPNSERPSGVKKAKAIQTLSDRTESFIGGLKDHQAKGAENQATAVAAMMAQMKESSVANLEKLDKIVAASTDKLTQTMVSGNKNWTKTMKKKLKSFNMKLLLETDISEMGATFQKKARKVIQKHFEATLLVDDEDSEDDEENDENIDNGDDEDKSSN